MKQLGSGSGKLPGPSHTITLLLQLLSFGAGGAMYSPAPLSSVGSASARNTVWVITRLGPLPVFGDPLPLHFQKPPYPGGVSTG